MATWHAYAKLRLHSDSTVASFRVVTVNLGHLLRKFAAETAKSFKTVALPSEEAITMRRHQNAAGKAKAAGEKLPPAPNRGKEKILNLYTPKLHFLGDYPDSIPEIGTTDSHTTANVCTILQIYFLTCL
jgi:hypothetical protein